MANLFKKTYSWLKSPTKNTHFQFSIILFCVTTIGFQAGAQFEFYNLSKEPAAALTALIYKKMSEQCKRHEKHPGPVVDGIHGLHA